MTPTYQNSAHRCLSGRRWFAGFIGLVAALSVQAASLPQQAASRVTESQAAASTSSAPAAESAATASAPSASSGNNPETQPARIGKPCDDCRYVLFSIAAFGDAGVVRMTRVSPLPPNEVDERSQFVVWIGGNGVPVQWLPRKSSRRFDASTLRAAVLSSGATNCALRSTPPREIAVEYYDSEPPSQTQDDAGITLTQEFALPHRKADTLYVLRSGETTLCGMADEPAIAALLVPQEIGARPSFASAVQAAVERRMLEHAEVPRVPEPEMPASQTLVRDEFETTADFNRRVDAERMRREQAIYELQQDYRQKVEARNQLILERQASRDADVARMTRESIPDALGALVLMKPEYDADNGLLYADVVSLKTDFSRRMAFRVPLEGDQARNLKARINEAQVMLSLGVSADRISVRGAGVALDGQVYPGKAADAQARTTAMQSIDLKSLDGRGIYTGVPAQLQNPDLVDRRELRYDDGAVNDDLRARVAALKAAAPDARKWLFVVAVENYDNADPVLYAKNSGELIVAAFQKKFGIPARNTYALIDEKATAGAFKDKFETLLGNIRAGDTVYFYYSGHGIPDQQTEESFILPRDKMVGFVAKEDYLRLSKIYADLEQSPAGRVHVFVDSCFSGKTDNVSNFKGVAPGVFRSHDVVLDSKKMSVMSAGKYNQFSNAYPERGHRMFSYFLLRSLLKARPAAEKVTVGTLYQDVAVGVRDASHSRGDAYLQEPQLRGQVDAAL